MLAIGTSFRPNWADAPALNVENPKGHDSYAIKVCAIVQGRSGCSSLTYVVDNADGPSVL